MKTVTPTELRSNIYRLLDEVLHTGIPMEVNKGGRKLRIVPVEKAEKFQNLIVRPKAIKGDPGDLVNIGWKREVNPRKDFEILEFTEKNYRCGK